MASSALVMQKDLLPDFITKVILDEYDQQQTCSKRGNNGNSDDVAYSAKDLKSSACKNCGKKGHTKDQCWKEGGRKAGKAPKWFKGKVWLASSADDDWLTKVAKEDILSPSEITADAKAALPNPSESAMDAESSSQNPSETALEAKNGPWKPSVPPLDVRYDFPNPLESTWDAENDVLNLLEMIPDEGDAYTETFDHVLLTGESPHLNEETILLDSGASHHMSSYWNKFLDYKLIILKLITMANSHTVPSMPLEKEI
ncbi:hypothetical protein EDD16DRAFT_1704848 [Pisolithus croceorrhizus]|nr:hypothetical protein EDD16DRAFT_1704848 [Pisolithus croceorrhizus]KAI6168954.1 hypothetical protein EDD17DRAFT_1749383 [Pisolithus thermaeus]